MSRAICQRCKGRGGRPRLGRGAGVAAMCGRQLMLLDARCRRIGLPACAPPTAAGGLVRRPSQRGRTAAAATRAGGFGGGCIALIVDVGTAPRTATEARAEHHDDDAAMHCWRSSSCVGMGGSTPGVLGSRVCLDAYQPLSPTPPQRPRSRTTAGTPCIAFPCQSAPPGESRATGRGRCLIGGLLQVGPALPASGDLSLALAQGCELRHTATTTSIPPAGRRTASAHARVAVQ